MRIVVESSNSRKGEKMAGKIQAKATSTPTLKKSFGPGNSTADFELYAPKAKSVSVAGTFNNWSTSAFKLKKDLRGNWNGSTNLKPGRYEYLFVVDGEWINDPKARETVTNPFGTINSVKDVR